MNREQIKKIVRLTEAIVNKRLTEAPKLNESVGQDIFTIKKYKYSDNEPVQYRIFSDGASMPTMSFEVPLKSVQAFEAKLFPELKKSISFINRQ